MNVPYREDIAIMIRIENLEAHVAVLEQILQRRSLTEITETTQPLIIKVQTCHWPFWWRKRTRYLLYYGIPQCAMCKYFKYTSKIGGSSGDCMIDGWTATGYRTSRECKTRDNHSCKRFLPPKKLCHWASAEETARLIVDEV